jgi:putative RNA 2'-phosphotransferase
MKSDRRAKASRFLSFVLRHNPDAAGIALDPSGWAKVGELLEAARLAGMHLDREALKVIVDTDPKKRYAMSADGTLIRANYGHSVPVDLGLDALEPPEYLFHGTSEPNLNAIRADGLQPRKRQFVHLSRDAPAAAIVGRRHGRPVVLSVRALEMHAGRHRFYHSESGIWLTKYVPPGYIIFPERRAGEHPSPNR